MIGRRRMTIPKRVGGAAEINYGAPRLPTSVRSHGTGYRYVR